MEQLYIGIDMGGTKCAVVAGHADGKILRRIAFPSGKDAHPDEFLPRFYEARCCASTTAARRRRPWV